MFKMRHKLEFGSGGGGGGGGPSKEELAKQRRADIGGYWDNYSQWVSEAGESLEKDTARARAELAASGMQAGSASWEHRLQGVRGAYDKRMEGIRGGEHHRQLQEYFEEFGKGSGKDMMQWYAEEFGKGGAKAQGGGPTAKKSKSAHEGRGRPWAAKNDDSEQGTWW